MPVKTKPKKVSKKKSTLQLSVDPFKIVVEKRHIEEGITKSSERCPVALAVKEKFGAEVRATPNSKEVETGQWKDSINHRITLKLPNSVLIFTMPKSVVKAIEEYDKTGKMKPFSFKIKF